MAWLQGLVASILLFIGLVLGFANLPMNSPPRDQTTCYNPCFSKKSAAETKTTGYYIVGGNVYYNSYLIKGADIPSFKPVLSPSGQQTIFARDRNTLYYGGTDVYDEGAFYCDSQDNLPRGTISVASFRPLFDAHGEASTTNIYARDSKHVYSDAVGGLCLIDGADPATFEPLLDQNGNFNWYSKDRARVYLQDQILNGIDAYTFHILFDDHGKASTYIVDKGIIYFAYCSQWGCAAKQVLGADLATFSVVDVSIRYPRYDAQDKYHLYRRGKIIQ